MSGNYESSIKCFKFTDRNSIFPLLKIFLKINDFCTLISATVFHSTKKVFTITNIKQKNQDLLIFENLLVYLNISFLQ